MTTRAQNGLQVHLRHQALTLLKNPRDFAWDEPLAEAMVDLTVQSIEVKLTPWPPGLLAAAKICSPEFVEAMNRAEQRVDNAFRARDMRALSHGCRGWFQSAHAVWSIAGGGR